jgi:hypothetical protein
MIRAVMHGTLIADVWDPEWREKLRALAKAGVNLVSVVLTMPRPGFSPPCEYPFVCIRGRQGDSWPNAEYDLASPNPDYWRHFIAVLTECAALGLMAQIDIFNEPSLRNGDPICWNRWGEDVGNFQRRPAGIWAQIVRAYSRLAISNYVCSPLRPVMYLGLLEGTGSREFEQFVYESVADLLLPGSIIVSNSVRQFPQGGLHLFKYSPHMKSLADVRDAAGPGRYLSDDGYLDNGPKAIAAAVKIAKQKGCAAYESLFGGALSGQLVLDANGEPHGTVPVPDRQRPKLSRLSRGVTPRMVKALVS